MLIRTIPCSDWSTIDDRAIIHPGVIVDLGCAPWNWSRFFIGKKRVIGADPFAELIPGVELFKGVIGSKNATVPMLKAGDSSTVITGTGTVITGNCMDRPVQMITWKRFKDLFKIGPISVLKVNIEGLEYDLIQNMDADDLQEIDQMAVSFHHRKWPSLTDATGQCLLKLEHAGFTIIPTNQPYSWYLALR